MDSHIRYDSDRKVLLLLDQKALPLREETIACETVDDVIRCIRDLTVRGAPAIGVAAAWGAVLVAEEATKLPAGEDWRVFVGASLVLLAEARPTAVNLAWAIGHMREVMRLQAPPSPEELARIWCAEAERFQAEDVATNKAMGRHGAALLQSGDTVLTHCNAGALATAGFGTALGVIRAAVNMGKKIRVIANETRPVLQGSRLTAFELARDGIPVHVACDNAAGLLMRKRMVDKVIVGADRIAANGDAANKIGTYTLAVLAKEHEIPFYVAAPFSTIDPATASGDAIPIEERGEEEVAFCGSCRIMPEGVGAYNFAFDVTPARLITGIITERGVLSPPFDQSIAHCLDDDYGKECRGRSRFSKLKEEIMNKDSIIQKVDEVVGNLREALRQNDGSTLSALASGVKQGFENARTAVYQNEKAQKALVELKKQLDEVEAAVHKGDKKLTSRLLDAIEGKIKKYKENNKDTQR